MFRPLTTLLATVLTLAAAATDAAERPVLEVTADVTLDPQQTYGAILVKASGVVIDGQGAWLVGPAADAASPTEYRGTAILAEGVDDVTLRHVNARGWETGLIVRDAQGWLVEDCDFSDNFHDPAFGWGENGRRGGILLERVTGSSLLRNRANRVWDGCVLVDAHDNLLEANDFSHTSNTCLKLWTSCRNTIRRNALTHGIRIDPGEVHARDSTCVLIESGSNDNRLWQNDCTHGGDGIFVRVLNGWNSTGNYFEGNDCSHANNNGFECWAPGNAFVANKANHCSYGFWLGGSDRTRLVGNEASFNGLPTGPHNSPHLPDGGHAGIVFMFGSSSHVLARGNRCEGNHGAGIALVGDLAEGGPAWKAYHWALEENVLVGNRQGIYAQHADWIVARANAFRDNVSGDIVTAGEVTRLTEMDSKRGADVAEASGAYVSARALAILAEQRRFGLASPIARIDGPTGVRVGQRAAWRSVAPSVDDDAHATDANPNDDEPTQFTWDAGAGQLHEGPTLERAFDRPGIATIAASASRGRTIEPLAATVYVTQAGAEIGTEGAAARWKIEDFQERTRSAEQTSRAVFRDVPDPRVAGASALEVQIEPYAGFRAALVYPSEGSLDLPLAEGQTLSFWLKAINADPTGWQGGPFLVLQGADGSRCYLEPRAGRDLMREAGPGEARDGWRLFEAPLAGDAKWERDGALPERLAALSIAVDSWGAPPLRLWLDGVLLSPAAR